MKVKSLRDLFFALEGAEREISAAFERRDRIRAFADEQGFHNTAIIKVMCARKFGNVSQSVDPAVLYEAFLAAREGPASRTGDARGFVYFVHFKNTDRLKIGFTERLETRLKSLANAGGEKCFLLGLIQGTKSLEYQALRAFAPWKAKGEWFHFTPESIAHVDQFVSGHLAALSEMEAA